MSKIKTGLGGTAGNKGGVALRFTFYNTSMCFICSHFAAHQGQVKQRNDDFKQIYEQTSFPQVKSYFHSHFSQYFLKILSIES